MTTGKTTASDPSIPNYFRKQPFMTISEKAIYQRICDVLPEYRVFPQVSMSALVATRAGVDIAREKIAQKYVDFAILDEGFNVVAIIELDDPTHEKPERKKADAEKDYALKTAGIRIARIKKSNVSADAIRKVIDLTKRQWNTPTRKKAAVAQKPSP